MEMEIESTGADILVHSLIQAGIEVIFGVPGDTGLLLYDCLYRERARLRHVMARDERSAAIMADAYARCTGRVGVVEASSGGGATYLVSGLGEAFAASVPLLVITSDIRQSSAGTHAITEIDQEQLFAAVTKWRRRVTDAAAIPALVAEALAACAGGRPAPVALILPEDVQEERAAVSLLTAADHLPRERHAAESASVQAAGAALLAATQPAIVAGSGVHWSQAYHELAALADAMGIPVATTIHGKGAIDERSVWSLGVVGANGARPAANDYLAGADGVLFIGTRANATDTHGFQCPPRQGPAVFHLDIDPARAGRNYPGSTALVGDVQATLGHLLTLVSSGPAARRRRLLDRMAQARRDWHDSPATVQPAVPNGGVVSPDAVLRAIDEVTDGQALLVADPGTPTPYVSAYWEIRRPGRTAIIPRGHGAMGYAIPAAIGAAVARQDLPIIALTTDGSFGMACGELETAYRLQLPIIYIHLRNNCFGWIKMLQHLYAEQRFYQVDFTRSDAPAIAAGFGLGAVAVSSADELAAALRHALRAGAGATFIDVPIPEEREQVPAVAPWLDSLAGRSGRSAY